MSERHRFISVLQHVRRYADLATDWAEFERKVAAGVSHEVRREYSAVLEAFRLLGRPVLLDSSWKDVGTVVAVSYHRLSFTLGGVCQEGELCVVPAGSKRFLELQLSSFLENIRMVRWEVIGVVASKVPMPADLSEFMYRFKERVMRDFAGKKEVST